MDHDLQQESQQSTFFTRTNKILLLVGAFFGIFIVIQLGYMYFNGAKIPGVPPKKPKVLPTLTPFPVPSAPAAANLEFYRTIRNGKAATEGQIVVSEYKGKLVGVKTAIDSITFSIENEEQVVNELEYGRNVPVDTTGLAIKDVREGDMVILTETSDVSKSFPNNIQLIKIVTYVE